MVKPTIHLNGTPAARLLESYLEAHEALSVGLKALEQAEPNARDYYPATGSFELARAEHTDRLKRVQSVLAEVCELCEHAANVR